VLSVAIMEPTFKSSFIPKQPVGDTVKKTYRPRRGGRFHFSTFITFIIFILSLVATGGEFLYLQFLQQSVAGKNESLSRAREAFQPTLIRDITRLDTRINVATEVLSKHIAPSAIFDILGSLTLEKVQLSNFQYRIDTAGLVALSMSAVAKDFNGIALQADAFGKSPDVKNPIVSNLALSGDNVTFAVTMNLDPSIVVYKGSIANESGSGLSLKRPLFVHE
jgi:hypothetical protein